MPYYGDVSGDFRGLLSGNCDACVVAVVGTDPNACQRCPNRAVRNTTDADEARWSDLVDVEKRRFIDCLEDCDDVVSGYATFTQSQLTTISGAYKLYQDQDWDIALRAYAYTGILDALNVLGSRASFYPDRFASTPQQRALEGRIEAEADGITATASGSRQRRGIQAADCIAGAHRDDLLNGTSWFADSIDVIQTSDCREAALDKLQLYLENV